MPLRRLWKLRSEEENCEQAAAFWAWWWILEPIEQLDISDL